MKLDSSNSNKSVQFYPSLEIYKKAPYKVENQEILEASNSIKIAATSNLTYSPKLYPTKQPFPEEIYEPYLSPFYKISILSEFILSAYKVVGISLFFTIY